MEGEENQKNNQDPDKDFGKVVDALHSKQKLSSLRTYQGDVAEFMKEKNESVISVALKQKERDEKLGVERPKPKRDNFKVNLTIVATSLALLAGGLSAIFYILAYIQKEPSGQISVEPSIFPHNNSVTLANTNSGNLASELAKLPAQNGISEIKISDQSGKLISKAVDFLDFLGAPKDISIRRTLKDGFMVGASSQNDQNYLFLVFVVNDYGTAFSSMLDWEKTMGTDLAFLTPKSMGPDAYSGNFAWKDLIIKNKDVRALINDKGESKIAYTFLDKNTIFITNNIFAIGDMASIFASRAVVR